MYDKPTDIYFYTSKPNSFFQIISWTCLPPNGHRCLNYLVQISDAYDKQLLVINGEKVTWYRPTSLSEAMEIKQTVPAAQFIGGASSFSK